jgi:hypothetical protein
MVESARTNPTTGSKTTQSARTNPARLERCRNRANEANVKMDEFYGLGKITVW